MMAELQRCFPYFDAKIISLYAREMSTREIAWLPPDLYGIDVLPDNIPTVIGAVREQVAAWLARHLDDVYPLLFFDAIRVKMRDEGMVPN